jgi:hypothetical protein
MDEVKAARPVEPFVAKTVLVGARCTLLEKSPFTRNLTAPGEYFTRSTLLAEFTGAARNVNDGYHELIVSGM